MAIVRVTRGPADLVSPSHVSGGETWRYGLAYPFQVAPRLGGILCNIRREFGPGVDFEVGSDVVLFDNLRAMGKAFAISRNHEGPNPKTKPPNQPAIMVKYPIQGGFVPLGAKRTDGSPHPHAGTGFGVVSVQAWPPDDRYVPKRRSGEAAVYLGRRPYPGVERYEFNELQQYRFDGSEFRALKTEAVAFSDLISGWTILNRGITCAIADGDDLLLPLVGGKEESRSGAGISRWKHGDNGWRAVSFTPVSGADQAFEPSLIRDTDGSLLMCARGSGEEYYNDVRVWRSTDGGAQWKKIIHARGIISSTPVVLNQAADGTPYVVANLNEVLMHPTDPRYRYPVDAQGRTRAGGWLREKLCLWPLNAGRTELEAPILVRDCRADFGAPPGGTTWNIDHPIAATLQLADGAWHNVLAVRVVERGEVTHLMGPTPQTGTYLEEVVSSGTAIPTWRF
ncbi:MAG: sialidase family protein [Bryobacteraceae bacterium]